MHAQFTVKQRSMLRAMVKREAKRMGYGAPSDPNVKYHEFNTAEWPWQLAELRAIAAKLRGNGI